VNTFGNKKINWIFNMTGKIMFMHLNKVNKYTIIDISYRYENLQISHMSQYQISNYIQ